MKETDTKQIEFEIHRVLLEYPSQRELFTQNLFPDRSQTLKKSLELKPSMQLTRQIQWSVGNVKLGEDGYIYFLTGKTSFKKQEVFNQETGDFKLELGLDSPFTICILNPDNGVIAIGRKSKLTPQTETVAKRIRQLIEQSLFQLKIGYQVKVKILSDPFGFIERISFCHAVKRFKFWVSPSNPIDIESRFHQPNKQLVDETGASEGAVSLKGDKLDKEVIKTLAISTNSVGDEATAYIQEKPKQKGTKISMKGNACKLLLAEDEVDACIVGDKITNAFLKIKGIDKDE